MIETENFPEAPEGKLGLEVAMEVRSDTSTETGSPLVTTPDHLETACPGSAAPVESVAETESPLVTTPDHLEIVEPEAAATVESTAEEAAGSSRGPKPPALERLETAGPSSPRGTTTPVHVETSRRHGAAAPTESPASDKEVLSPGRPPRAERIRTPTILEAEGGGEITKHKSLGCGMDRGRHSRVAALSEPVRRQSLDPSHREEAERAAAAHASWEAAHQAGKEPQVRVQVLFVSNLSEPEYRFGDKFSSVVGMAMPLGNVYVTLELGDKSLSTSPAPNPKGEKHVKFDAPEKLTFTYQNQEYIDIAVRDRRGIQGLVRGDPLIGEGKLPLNDTHALAGQVATVEVNVMRQGYVTGIVGLRWQANVLPPIPRTMSPSASMSRSSMLGPMSSYRRRELSRDASSGSLPIDSRRSLRQSQQDNGS